MNTHQCGCGHAFDGELLGAWGCPNCEGDEGPAEAIEHEHP